MRWSLSQSVSAYSVTLSSRCIASSVRLACWRMPVVAPAVSTACGLHLLLLNVQSDPLVFRQSWVSQGFAGHHGIMEFTESRRARICGSKCQLDFAGSELLTVVVEFWPCRECVLQTRPGFLHGKLFSEQVWSIKRSEKLIKIIGLPHLAFANLRFLGYVGMSHCQAWRNNRQKHVALALLFENVALFRNFSAWPENPGSVWYSKSCRTKKSLTISMPKWLDYNLSQVLHISYNCFYFHSCSDLQCSPWQSWGWNEACEALPGFARVLQINISNSLPLALLSLLKMRIRARGSEWMPWYALTWILQGLKFEPLNHQKQTFDCPEGPL